MTNQFLSQLTASVLRLVLIGCCAGLPWRLGAAEPARNSNAAPPATAAGDQPFQDPFAKEDARTRPTTRISDPIEPVNRGFFWFNDKLYFWVLRPSSRAYSKVAPKPVRTSVHRFFFNIKFPVRFVNKLLQARFAAPGEETARFVVNSTAGVAGFFDPADKLRLKPQLADFDQTLGLYGIHPGFYLDLPILGPSSARGAFGVAGDAALTPWTHLDFEISVPVQAYDRLNETSLHPGEYEDFKKHALDPYIALRSAYYDNRQSFIEQARAARKAEYGPLKATRVQSPKGVEQWPRQCPREPQ